MEEAYSKGKRILFYTSMVLLSCIIVFVVGEVAVRVTGIGAPNYNMLYNNTVAKGKPFAKYMNLKENRNLVRLNNWGFHDYDREQDNDRYRVLFLGDSMLEGAQVPVDSLFTSLVEKRFQRENKPVESINAGLSGTGTTHQYLLWKEFFQASGIRIDHVVLCFFLGNDLENNHRALDHAPGNFSAYLDAEGNIDVIRTDYSLFQSGIKRLADYSALVGTVYRRIYLLKRAYLNARKRAYSQQEVPTGSSVGPGAQEPADPDERRVNVRGASARQDSFFVESVKGTLRLIEKWNKELSTEGHFLSVVVIPSTGANNQFEEAFVSNLKDLALQDSMRVLELHFGDRSPYETNSFDGVTLGHFNYLGHRLAADTLVGWLNEQIEARSLP